MSLPPISKAEWTVMEALWAKPDQSASELTKNLLSKTSWADNTVRTLLKRLVEKGVLQVKDRENGTRSFFPAIDRDAIVQTESRSFLDRVFQGAAKPLLVHFAQNTELTAAEVQDLKQLLDQSLKGRP